MSGVIKQILYNKLVSHDQSFLYYNSLYTYITRPSSSSLAPLSRPARAALPTQDGGGREGAAGAGRASRAPAARAPRRAGAVLRPPPAGSGAGGRGRCGRRCYARGAGPGPRRGAAGAGGTRAWRGGRSVPGGMFRKARRVNVRKRNDSEEEDEERDEEPPQEPAPAVGAAGEGPSEASVPLAPGAGLLPLPAGCVPLALPGSPAAFACPASYGAALGLGLGLMGGERAGLGVLPAPAVLRPPPPPPQPQQGNGLPAAGRPKEKKRSRENKEVPRASLLSFQDEEEGEADGWLAFGSLLAGVEGIWSCSACIGPPSGPPRELGSVFIF